MNVNRRKVVRELIFLLATLEARTYAVSVDIGMSGITP